MRIVRIGLSLMSGILVGVLLHFALYRFGLPIQPFIYQAF
jgi:hypothetical protein